MRKKKKMNNRVMKLWIIKIKMKSYNQKWDQNKTRKINIKKKKNNQK